MSNFNHKNKAATITLSRFPGKRKLQCSYSGDTSKNYFQPQHNFLKSKFAPTLDICDFNFVQPSVKKEDLAKLEKVNNFQMVSTSYKT